MAGVFLVETDDSWVTSGTVDDAPYILISDESRFKSLDKGGTIYSLPSDTFENDPDIGLKELEWRSREPVTPTAKEYIPSALEDMVRHGVKVYFVDKETYDRIQTAPEGGESIVKSLVPYAG